MRYESFFKSSQNLIDKVLSYKLTSALATLCCAPKCTPLHNFLNKATFNPSSSDVRKTFADVLELERYAFVSCRNIMTRCRKYFSNKWHNLHSSSLAQPHTHKARFREILHNFRAHFASPKDPRGCWKGKNKLDNENRCIIFISKPPKFTEMLSLAM